MGRAALPGARLLGGVSGQRLGDETAGRHRAKRRQNPCVQVDAHRLSPRRLPLRLRTPQILLGEDAEQRRAPHPAARLDDVDLPARGMDAQPEAGQQDAPVPDPVLLQVDDLAVAAAGQHQQPDDGDLARAVWNSSRISTALSRAIPSAVRNRSISFVL